MKRVAGLIGLGLLVCAVAYATAYFFGMTPARRLADEPVPELGWLKKEFNLTDAEFERISQLHESYQPHCAEMCSRIDAKNAEIKDALAHANQMTPEIERKLAEAAQLRADCQTAMLRHFFAVSQSMPPEQGRRYLAWVEAQTFLPMQGMSAASVPTPHEH